MGSQNMSATWQHYDHSLRTSLQDCLIDNALVDVTLVARDKATVKAHKLILAANSSYFRDIFTRSNPHSEVVVVLPNTTHTELDSLMQYWYSGKINVREEHIPNMMELANSLQVRGLAKLLHGLQQQTAPSSSVTSTHAADAEDSSRPPSSQSTHSTDVAAERPTTRFEHNQSVPAPMKRKRRRTSNQSSPNIPNARIPSGLTVIPLNEPTAQDGGPENVKAEADAEISSNIDYTENTSDYLGGDDPTIYQDGGYQYYDTSHLMEDSLAEGDDAAQIYYGEDSAEQEYPDDENDKKLCMTSTQSSSSLQDSGGYVLPAFWDNRIGPKQEPYQCSRCMKIFQQKWLYQRHIRFTACFGRKERVACRVCGVEIGSGIHNYRAHLMNTHRLPKQHIFVQETYKRPPHRSVQSLMNIFH